MERYEAIKKWGIVYSPDDVVQKITHHCLQRILSDRPMTVLDISCGNGVFLKAACELLAEEYYTNRSKYSSFLPQFQSKEDALRYVAENCIFGIDIQSSAIQEAASNICQGMTEVEMKDRLVVADALTVKKQELPSGWPSSFDVLLGNPPYIGHKHLSKERREELSEYSDVFMDKSDLSFCFLKRMCEWMHADSMAGVLTSRALIDAYCGCGIRSYLNRHIEVSDIYDFTDLNIFPNINVLSVAVLFSLKKQNSYQIRVERVCRNNEDSSMFRISSDALKNRRWSLLKPSEREFIETIERNCIYQLGDIVDFYQGIITGLDKAFIVSEDQIIEYSLEEELLHPWIKSTMIQKKSIDHTSYRIIYADDIPNEESFPHTLKYIRQYQSCLMKRRECAKGYRPWYGLQWGRKKAVFEKPKIIFPYKSENNRFVIDEEGHMFSADVYGMIIKPEMEQLFSLPFLQEILNSELYARYFRLFAKKGVNRQYDYYPNALKEMYIPTYERYFAFPFC